MKLAEEWGSALPKNSAHELSTTKTGKPTLTINGLLLHSRYDPEQEAARLVDSANLDPGRPVLVVGMGLGYHVAELLRRGHEVAVTEPDAEVAGLALEHGASREGYLLHVGEAASLPSDAAFQEFARRDAQLMLHPPTAKLHPGYVEAVEGAKSAALLAGQRLNIAIVGPMYGGSLPIAGYLERAFASLGHRTLLVDNSAGWPVYEEMSRTVDSAQAKGQLGNILTHYLSEWTYARVAEFDPEICIVLAQGPVADNFPYRLAQQGILTAFWYVENWRHMPYWQEVARHYDAFFHIQPGEFEEKLDAVGCKHHAFIQTGCDPELHRPASLSGAEKREFSCDLSFAGAGYYNRLQVFKGLTDLNFKIWGVEWGERELAHLVQGGERRFDSETFMKICAGSKINLNLHSSATHDGVDPGCDALNPRVFEIAAAGAFQVCDPCKGLADHFSEDEVPTYRSLAELREKVAYYLAHPEERTACAKRARERALAEHTYAHRAQAMLDFLFARHGARILKKGVRVQRSVGEMAARLPEGDPLRDWLRSLPADTPFTREALKEKIQLEYERRTYPEHVFNYIIEVFNFADGLLREKG